MRKNWLSGEKVKSSEVRVRDPWHLTEIKGAAHHSCGLCASQKETSILRINFDKDSAKTIIASVC